MLLSLEAGQKACESRKFHTSVAKRLFVCLNKAL